MNDYQAHNGPNIRALIKATQSYWVNDIRNYNDRLLIDFQTLDPSEGENDIVRVHHEDIAEAFEALLEAGELCHGADMNARGWAHACARDADAILQRAVFGRKVWEAPEVAADGPREMFLLAPPYPTVRADGCAMSSLEEQVCECGHFEHWAETDPAGRLDANRAGDSAPDCFAVCWECGRVYSNRALVAGGEVPPVARYDVTDPKFCGAMQVYAHEAFGAPEPAQPELERLVTVHPSVWREIAQRDALLRVLERRGDRVMYRADGRTIAQEANRIAAIAAACLESSTGAANLTDDEKSAVFAYAFMLGRSDARKVA